MWNFFFETRENKKKHGRVVPLFLLGFFVCGFSDCALAAENTPNVPLETRQDRTLGNPNSIFIGRDPDTGDRVIRTPQITQPSQPTPPSVYYISPDVNVPSGNYYSPSTPNWQEPNNFSRPNYPSNYPFKHPGWSDNSDRYNRPNNWQQRPPRGDRPPQWGGTTPPPPPPPGFNPNSSPNFNQNSRPKPPPNWNNRNNSQWNSPPPPPPPGWGKDRYKNEPPAWGKHKKPKHKWDHNRRRHDYRRYY